MNWPEGPDWVVEKVPDPNHWLGGRVRPKRIAITRRKRLLKIGRFELTIELRERLDGR